MKKIIVGSLLTTIGAFSNIALFITISFHANNLGSWTTPPGKFLSVIQNTGASMLVFPIILATICLIVGLYNLFVSEDK